MHFLYDWFVSLSLWQTRILTSWLLMKEEQVGTCPCSLIQQRVAGDMRRGTSGLSTKRQFLPSMIRGFFFFLFSMLTGSWSFPPSRGLQYDSQPLIFLKGLCSSGKDHGLLSSKFFSPPPSLFYSISLIGFSQLSTIGSASLNVHHCTSAPSCWIQIPWLLRTRAFPTCFQLWF